MCFIRPYLSSSPLLFPPTHPADPAQLNLFFSDLVQALGAVMDIRWIHNGVVKTGGFCAS